MRGLISLLLAAGLTSAAQAQDMQFQRLDASFSDIAIDVQRADVEHRLTQVDYADCMQWDECDWRDQEGVRYHFWKKKSDDIVLVAKMVEASDFEGREIAALGIGLARERGDVLAKMGAFLGHAEIACDTRRYGHQSCGVSVGPGYVSAIFNSNGQLSGLVFDGYFHRW